MRRRGSRAPEHPEERVPWASFADALTGLLFVFILLALSFAWQLKQVEAQAAQKLAERQVQVEQAKRAMRLARELVGTGQAAKAHSVAVCLEDKSRDLADGQGVWLQPSANESDASLALYLFSDAMLTTTIQWFDSGQATLSDRPEAIARQIGPCIEQALSHPDFQDEFMLRVFVEGHTDFEPLRGQVRQFETNWELSGARAAAVVRVLVDPECSGVQPDDCDASPKKLKEATAAGQLDIIAAGLADRRPAWHRICEQEGGDDAVCTCLQANGGKARECDAVLKDYMRANGIEGPDTSLDRLVAWANHEVDPFQGPQSRTAGAGRQTRKSMQRRVDLRFEVIPRDPTRVDLASGVDEAE